MDMPLLCITFEVNWTFWFPGLLFGIVNIIAYLGLWPKSPYLRHACLLLTVCCWFQIWIWLHLSFAIIICSSHFHSVSHFIANGFLWATLDCQGPPSFEHIQCTLICVNCTSVQNAQFGRITIMHSTRYWWRRNWNNTCPTRILHRYNLVLGHRHALRSYGMQGWPVLRWPITRYVQRQIAHEPGMPGTFSPPLTPK